MDTLVDHPPKLTNGYHNGHIEKNGSMEDHDIKTKEKAEPVHKAESITSRLNGPNQIIPASEYSTTLPHGSVKLRIGKNGISAETPISVPSLLSRTVARYPDKIALAVKTADGTWEKTTFKEYQQLVRICAKAFLKLGLEQHHSVCILGFNSPQWFISDLAAIHAGGFAAGVYTTNTAEACHHVLSNSRANIVVVEDSKQMDKIVSIWSRLPHLKAAIQWDGTPKKDHENIYTWEQVMAMGKEEPEAKLNEALKSIAINECCTLVYTSGTVGQPKAVMLSHDNILWEGTTLTERLNLDPGNEVIISYLPLSHIAAQIMDVYLTLMNSVTVYFADKDALKGSLIKTLTEVQPTRFLGVPRVWEKIYEKMTAIGASNGFLKRSIAGWAKQQSLNHYLEKIQGNDYSSFGYLAARFLILKKVHAALGFANCQFFATAAAPLSADVKRYFLSLDIPIMDIFGMSEAGGAHCFSSPDDFNLESIGKTIDGAETRFENPDPVTGHGEICMRGRHVFMGYLGEPKKTEEAIDKDGWLLSGDVGSIDKNNFIYITGRIKELIITAGGENVAPVLIEQNLKSEMVFVSHAVVVGDRRKFLSVLLTFKTEMDTDSGAPLDQLSADSLRWLKSLGSTVTTVSEILNKPNEDIMKAIQEGLVRANVQAISNAQKVQKFAILPADLTTFSGELGPTLKIKRNVVADKYSDLIDSLYKD